MRIATFEVSAIVDMVEEGLRRLKQRVDMDGRSSGYFTLADLESGAPLLIARIGVIKPEKLFKYLALCQEKVLRLRAASEHKSSFQSRNAEAQQYSGAVKVGKFILSFSGLTETADEALMLYVAHAMDLISDIAVKEIAALSGNTHIEKIL